MKLAGPYAVVALWSAALIAVPQPAQAQGNDGKLSVSMGVDASHAYFFRGIRQERQGLVVQPFADASFALFEDGEGLTDVTLTIGQWNSLHSGPSGAEGPAANVASWYESDFFTGVTLGLENWEAGITYTSYLSPNDSFGTVHELSLALIMDDSELLNGFALAPHVGIDHRAERPGGRWRQRRCVSRAWGRAGPAASRGRGVRGVPRHVGREPQ